MTEAANIIILFIVTSMGTMGSGSDKPTGAWLEEVTTPYYAFKDAGYEVVVLSPKGGEMPVDPRSLEGRGVTESVKRYQNDEQAQAVFANMHKLSDWDGQIADAVFIPGGHGPMFDLADNIDAGRIIMEHFSQNKPVAAVCHGPAVLFSAYDEYGNWFFKDMEMTGFSNAEESAVGLTDEMPFLLENRMVDEGAKYVRVKNFEPNVVVDRHLITGQNPASAGKAADQTIHFITLKKETLRF